MAWRPPLLSLEEGKALSSSRLNLLPLKQETRGQGSHLLLGKAMTEGNALRLPRIRKLEGKALSSSLEKRKAERKAGSSPEEGSGQGSLIPSSL